MEDNVENRFKTVQNEIIEAKQSIRDLDELGKTIEKESDPEKILEITKLAFEKELFKRS